MDEAMSQELHDRLAKMHRQRNAARVERDEALAEIDVMNERCDRWAARVKALEARLGAVVSAARGTG